MLRTPPHILVTTPESLYLLLTAERSREMLRTARTVIVDEIHAVIGTRRGAHLALSLERLQQVAGQPLLRIGLSATQKPIEEVGAVLSVRQSGDRTNPTIRIVDEGHRRAMDLGLELPGSPLEAVMSHEVWEEYLQPADRAHRPAPDDADLREHAADGRARRASPERSSRRRGGHGPSRQPVEGQAARRRVAAQERAS